MFLARWLFGISAGDWYTMMEVERVALMRGIERWLPRILFGADAPPLEKPKTLNDLPGGQIVKAY